VSVGQAVLTFLESVGRPAEGELYLRLFRSMPRGHFAAVVPARTVLEESLGTLSEQLTFLTELGLYPSVVLGATGPAEPSQVAELLEALEFAGARAALAAGSVGEAAAEAERLAGERTLPVFVLADPSDATLAALTVALCPRKVIVLRGAGGLGPHGVGSIELGPGHFVETNPSGIGALNLRSDLAALREVGVLSEADLVWLERLERLLEATADVHAMTVSVASPLSLLRELFTVRGEGTLLKLGSFIDHHSSFERVERERLEHLLRESFGRELRGDFWARTPTRVYLERDYRGVALLEPGRYAPYLSKFAVLPVARGEGLGQELWREMLKDTPRLFWRSRPENPVNSWYVTVCDGMQRTPEWHVYWRGASAEQVPALVAEALARPEDFLPRVL
jgi:acetylglutamate kinase